MKTLSILFISTSVLFATEFYKSKPILNLVIKKDCDLREKPDAKSKSIATPLIRKGTAPSVIDHNKDWYMMIAPIEAFLSKNCY